MIDLLRFSDHQLARSAALLQDLKKLINKADLCTVMVIWTCAFG